MIALEKECQKVLARLEYLNKLSGGFFNQSRVTPEEEAFAEALPWLDEYRKEKIKFLHLCEKLLEERRGKISFDHEMTTTLFIAADYALLCGDVVAMNHYLQKIDITRWDPAVSPNPLVQQMWRDLSRWIALHKLQ